MNTAAIGIFDSGLGGLTVAREIAQLLPAESLLYVGDQARCPYGPRDTLQVQSYVHQIGSFLANSQAKLIVIACNTATSCALDIAKQHFDVPVIGVIDAGARAALNTTSSGTVAVIGTERTIASGAFPTAIRRLCDQTEVLTHATPELAKIVESGLEDEVAHCEIKRREYYLLVESYLRPLLESNYSQLPDTLLLGCTHYPVLSQTLQIIAGPGIKVICAASEVANEVKQVLTNTGQLADQTKTAQHVFYTTAENTELFAQRGAKIFGSELATVRHISIDEICVNL